MPELVILAAGIGSRYGGLKQIDPVGPHNQIILDYSIYDAVEAGFSRIVFVIRREIETSFKSFIGSRYDGHIPCAYTYQELDTLPQGTSLPPGRKKPWGTGHALWVCEGMVDQPFAVINADDYYGRAAYREMHRFLLEGGGKTSTCHYGMVGFQLENTLSEHGSVSRGICVVDPDGRLVSVTERPEIERSDHGIQYKDGSGRWQPLTGREIVSMNFWGFTPGIFAQLGDRFSAFLAENIDSPATEFYLPGAVDDLIDNGQASVSVMTSLDRWTGVTNPGDKPQVSRHLAELTQEGIYPEKLWG